MLLSSVPLLRSPQVRININQPGGGQDRTHLTGPDSGRIPNRLGSDQESDPTSHPSGHQSRLGGRSFLSRAQERREAISPTTSTANCIHRSAGIDGRFLGQPPAFDHWLDQPVPSAQLLHNGKDNIALANLEGNVTHFELSQLFARVRTRVHSKKEVILFSFVICVYLVV